MKCVYSNNQRVNVSLTVSVLVLGRGQEITPLDPWNDILGLEVQFISKLVNSLGFS